MTNHTLLAKIQELKQEVETYLAEKGVKVPEEFIATIKKDKKTMLLLQSIFEAASAYIGLDVRETIAYHYKAGYLLLEDVNYWSQEDQELVKSILLHKVQSAPFSEKYSDLFFVEGVKLSAEQKEEVLSMYRDIASAAIEYCFGANEEDKPALHARAFEQILKIHDLPYTQPMNDDITIRNLISIDRLKDITKNEMNSLSLEALKEVARKWYRASGRDFLERKSGYHQYDYVKNYLYILTGEQLESLRKEFLEDVENQYKRIKSEAWNRFTISSVDYLQQQLEAILSWKTEL
jgi:hypothetical protein